MFCRLGDERMLDEEDKNRFTVVCLVNPNSGSRQATQCYRDIVEPMCLAGDILTLPIYTSECLFKQDTYRSPEGVNVSADEVCNTNSAWFMPQVCKRRNPSGASKGADDTKIDDKIEIPTTKNEKELDKALTDLSAKVTKLIAKAKSAKDANAAFLDFYYKVKKADKRFYGVVALSGDGTLNEALNLFDRSGIDVSQIPWAILPCGTSDGLSTSIYDRRKEKHEITTIQKLVTEGAQASLHSPVFLKRENGAFIRGTRSGCFEDGVFKDTFSKVRFAAALMVEAIRRKEVQPFDAYRASMEVVGGDKESANGINSMLDFHHTCWGLLSDVDLELENPAGWSRKFLPKSIRSTLVPLKHILNLKKHRCKLRIWEDKSNNKWDVKPTHTVEGDDFYFASILSCNYIDPDLIMIPGARFNDGLLHVMVKRDGRPDKSDLSKINKSGIIPAVKMFGELETGTHVLGSSGAFFEYYRGQKVEITVGGNESGENGSRLDVCGNGEKPFACCYEIDPETQERKMKNIGKDRKLTCEILSGKLKLMLPVNF